MNTIVASLIAGKQKELDERAEKILGFADAVQFDVMDGKMVEHHSLDFDFKMPGTAAKTEAHLMVENPVEWIEKHCQNIDVVIVHSESRDIEAAFEKIKEMGKKPGIGINPETSVEEIMPYLEKVNHALVMTVHPGRYGARFLPEMLPKVRKIRELKPKIDIEVDGGINPGTVEMAKEAGANLFVVGSYIQNADNPEDAYNEMKELVK